MFKAWVSMWKNIGRYSGTVSVKEYWLALLMNVIFMYVGVIPYALIARCLTDNVTAVITLYLIAVHLPVLALYFRRAYSAGWKLGTTVYLALTIPALSGILVGLISHCGIVGKGYAFTAKLFALCFGLFFYGGLFGLILYDDVTAIPAMPVAGLLIGSLTLIGYGLIHWKEVLAFFSGSGAE